MPFPDDPPPHEGAMISLPIVIQPPDLVMVEVLEALPGRPVSGERLVRPDGTLNLGFYGVIEVRGLTVAQAKEKIVLHMRRYLTDDSLGLWENVSEDDDADAKAPTPAKPVPNDADKKNEPQTLRPNPRQSGILQASRRSRVAPASDATNVDDEEKSATPVHVLSPFAEAETAHSVNVPSAGGVKITIEIHNQTAEGAKSTTEALPPPDTNTEAWLRSMKCAPVAAADTDRVMVDVTAYNSMCYFVQGDVVAPGRLPWTGNETVLEVMNYAGGLIPSADRKKIRLIRPARGGKPSRVYPIDLEAILDKGDPKANLQILPGDRLVVGRLDAVQKTIDLDRFAAPLHTAIYTMNQYLNVVKNLPTSESVMLTPAQRDAILKSWVDLWWKIANESDGTKLDEKTFKDALLRNLKPPPISGEPEKK
jgi:protein involved in polysaccharide export with SLBB domain